MGGFGRLIGGLVGAVIGSFIPGVGTAIGFAIGGFIGGIIDPAKSASPGVAKQQLQFTTNEIGIPIPDLLGTGKISGIFLCYGKERSKKQYSKSGGKGFGGGSKQVTGYKYYMSWVQAICSGPVNTLYAIYADNDTLLWSGELNCPVSGGVETIVIDDFGTVYFYFGTTDHAINTKIGALLDDATLNSPLRGLCYAFFDDCYIGQYNRCPSIHFVLRKCPALGESEFSEDEGTIHTYDFNPAYAQWYILNTLTGLPATWLDAADFAAAGYLLYLEGRGLSILFDPQQSALDYLQTINEHIDAIIQYGSDGKFHPKLIRDDYDVAALPTADEDVFLEDPTFSRASWIDTVNEIKTLYTEITERPYEERGVIQGTGNELFCGYDVPGVVGIRGWTSLPNIGKVAQAACGPVNTFIIKNDGTLWGAGENQDGQLGIGEEDVLEHTPFEKIAGGIWRQVCAGRKIGGGGGHWTMAIKDDRSLWVTGDNDYGQLGLGNTTKKAAWTKVTALGDGAEFSYVNCQGHGTSMVLTHNALYACGLNDVGQCGINSGVGSVSTWTRCIMTELNEVGTFDSFAVGGYHALAIAAGILYGTGQSYYGQLGNGSQSNNVKFLLTGAAIPGSVKAACGRQHSLVLDINGDVWGTGSNVHGQLGLADSIEYIYSFQKIFEGALDIACGGNFSFIIASDGTLWGSGENTNWELGIADGIEKFAFTRVDTSLVYAVAGGDVHAIRLLEMSL